MKLAFLLVVFLVAPLCSAAVEHTGQVKTVKIWGSIAKATVCNSEDECVEYWVSLGDEKAQSVLSLWLAAKLSSSQVYIQGYEPDKAEHPYSNASRFYGMNLK